MQVNILLFNFYFYFQARKNLLAIFQTAVDKRRSQRREKIPGKKAKDMMDALIDVEDENGRKLGDEDVIDIMLMYLNAGHESSGHITMWATYFLQRHPECFRKAKVSSNFQLLMTLNMCIYYITLNRCLCRTPYPLTQQIQLYLALFICLNRQNKKKL